MTGKYGNPTGRSLAENLTARVAALERQLSILKGGRRATVDRGLTASVPNPVEGQMMVAGTSLYMYAEGAWNLVSGCPSEVLDSAYAMEVWYDEPIAYWQCQDMIGPPKDCTGTYPMTLVQGGSGNRNNIAYRADGALTSSCDKSLSVGTGGDPGGVFYRMDNITTVTDDFTIETWVYMDGAPPFADRVYWTGSYGTDGFGVYMQTNRTFRYQLDNSTFGSNSSALADGWHHIVVVRDAGTWKYYVDGSVDVSNAGTDTPTAPSIYTQFDVGAHQRQSHVAFYESVLSPTRIAAHYAAR